MWDCERMVDTYYTRFSVFKSLSNIPINLSAKFWSPMFVSAVANASRVAPCCPSLSIHFTKRAMQHSLLQPLSLSVVIINASLNPSSRAKSFHLVPISSGRRRLWISDSISWFEELECPKKNTLVNWEIKVFFCKIKPDRAPEAYERNEWFTKISLIQTA